MNTLNTPVSLSKEYATKISKLRIFKDYDDEWPWVIDGFSETENTFTEACGRYQSFEKAVNGIRDFLKNLKEDPNVIVTLLDNSIND